MIDDGAFVMQGAMLRGPLYIGKQAVVKMGATLYAGTSIGHQCVVGGEIKNSVFYPYSNKAHHGYIGDSIIGSWCNLGAGTTCSNLKNTVGKIKVWDIHTNSFKLSIEKMGILMGDHVRTAVHTSFNSGTVIGSFANIFELQGLSPKYIPSFSWGGNQNRMYTLDKLIEDTGRWMNLKNIVMDEQDKEQIVTLYNQLNQA
jgi:UDP-N-acetylglucosamine diphosphorylase/glucosamine-1-phosphate N-acetyltransferase